jgi:parvulin-like peptidyl-prolyl isomerase
VARSRRRNWFQGEDRQNFLVTAFFVGLIVLALVFLIGAVAVAYYNDNIRSVARVGSLELGPGLVRERAALLRNRIDLEVRRITPAIIDGELDATRGQQRVTELGQQRDEIGTVAIEGLIDIIYQSQLAADRGITVSEQEVDQRMADELATTERRHVWAIEVEPQAADEEEGPTLNERREARERAEQALAELNAGADFATVAREYSTAESAAQGGDLGVISRLAPVDEFWIDAVFKLAEDGTTAVIAGADDVYRIGRVTEIQPRNEEPGRRSALLRDLSEERYREFLRYELAAEKLSNEIVAETIAAPVDQIRLAHIFIEGATAGEDEDGAEGGEIQYSEIGFAPNDNLEDAPDLPQDDPAWEAARQEAQAAFDELQAISDPEERAERFAELAADSDLPSADRDGDAGFFTRDVVPEPVAEALFDSEHQEGDLIGPLRAPAAYYVMLFHERRGSPADRLAAVQAALAEPDADFAAIAAEHSDGENAEDGGELGWFTREMLNPTIADDIFELSSGEVGEPMDLGEGAWLFKALERAERPLDADQLTDVRANAFERWYAPLKDEAENQRVIVRADDIEGDVGPDEVPDETGDEPGLDIPEDE